MSHVDDGALHAYLDGELTPVERARVEAHVAECAACRGRLDEERGLIERAGQLLGLAQPPERAAPPLHQLRQPRPVWRLRVPLAWAATVVLALGIGYYVGEMPLGRSAPDAVALHDSTDAVAVSQQAPTPAAAPAPTQSPARDMASRSTRRSPEESPVERRRLGEVVVTGTAVQDKDKANAAPTPVIVDGSLYSARRDSVAAAAGVVSIRQPEMRAVTPAPAAAADSLPARMEAAVVAVRGRQLTTEWPIIRRDPARQVLGADPVGVPGLAVRQMRRSPAGDGVIVVEQVVDSATVIQLFQRRGDQVQAAEKVATRSAEPAARAAAPEGYGYTTTERLARFVGSLRVEIAGPLSTDSLNKLLEQLKPLP